MRMLLGAAIGVFVVFLAASAFAMPIAPLEKNYTQLVQKATCNTYCYPERRDSWGNTTAHAYCTTRCY